MIGRPVRDPRTARPGLGVVTPMPPGLCFGFRSDTVRFDIRSIEEAREHRAADDQQRISPLEPPYAPEVAETLRRMMPPGVEPLRLFRTVAHNPAVLERFRTIGATS